MAHRISPTDPLLIFVVRHLLRRDKNTQSSVSILECLVSDITEEGKNRYNNDSVFNKIYWANKKKKKKNQQNISDSSLRKYPVLEMEHAVTTKNLWLAHKFFFFKDNTLKVAKTVFLMHYLVRMASRCQWHCIKIVKLKKKRWRYKKEQVLNLQNI